MSDRTKLIERLAPGYVECEYNDAERGTDDGARKAISKSAFSGTVEVGLFLPDRPGVQLMYGPVIWLCLESVARDLKTLRQVPIDVARGIIDSWVFLTDHGGLVPGTQLVTDLHKRSIKWLNDNREAPDPADDVEVFSKTFTHTCIYSGERRMCKRVPYYLGDASNLWLVEGSDGFWSGNTLQPIEEIPEDPT